MSDDEMEVHAQERLQAAAEKMQQRTARLRLLVSALKSGGWPQTTGVLRRLRDDDRRPAGFCCLGVACEVAIANGADVHRRECGTPHTRSHLYYSGGGSSSHVRLPHAARAWFGVAQDDPSLNVPGHIAAQHVGKLNFDNWSQHHTYSASTLNDEAGLSLAEIGECFQYTYLREDWEAEHGAAAAQ